MQQALEAWKTKLDDQILEDVRQLGHYPRRFKKRSTDKEKAETSLARRISERWSELNSQTQEELERLDSQTQEELERLQQDSRDKRTVDILERLRAFGKWPREHGYSQASDQESITEAKLTHDLRKCRSAGILNKAAEAEIDEMHWMWMREQEAEAMERKAAACAERQAAAKERKTRMRSLLDKLHASKHRCDCNDFAHWCNLWRCDWKLAQSLRQGGHHFMHCEFARRAAQPAHMSVTCAQEEEQPFFDECRLFNPIYLLANLRLRGKC